MLGKKRLIFLIVGFLLLSTVSGLVAQQNTDVNIKHTIAEDGLSSGVTANITIKDPTGVVIVPFSVMNYSETDNQFSYNLSSGNTSKLGTYTYDICAEGPTEKQCFSFSFEVTPSGESTTLENTISRVMIILVLLVLAVIFAGIGLSFDNKRWIIKSGLYAGALLIMIIAVNIGILFTTGPSTSTLMTTALIITNTVLVLLFMYILITYIIGITRAVKESKEARETDLGV